MLDRIRSLFGRKQEPMTPEAKEAFERADVVSQTVHAIVQSQLMLARRSMNSISKDLWSAGYVFGVCAVTMQNLGYDMTTSNQASTAAIFASTLRLFDRNQKKALAFAEFIGKATGNPACVRGIVAAQKDMEAFYARLSPVRLMTWLTDGKEFVEPPALP